MRKTIYIFSFILLLPLMFSCKKSISAEEQMELDIQEIKDYIAKHELDAERTSSGLHYVIINEGSGNHPKATDNVRVRYKGYTTDGKVFDESQEEGIAFNLQGVIAGWTEGIPKFKEGGSGILLIPSALAYGTQGASTIKPNTVLIFDVDLLNIEN